MAFEGLSDKLGTAFARKAHRSRRKGSHAGSPDGIARSRCQL